MTLQIVMFAYLAVELVGVTAGESEDPEKTLPKAINTAAVAHRRSSTSAPSIMILSRRPVDRVPAGRQPLRRRLRARSASRHRRRDRQLRRADRRALLLQLGHVLHRPHAARPRAQRPGPEGLHQADRRGTPRSASRSPRRSCWLGVWINYVAPGKAFDYVISFATVCRHVDLDHDPGLPDPLPPPRSDAGRPAAVVLPRPGRRRTPAGSRWSSSAWSSVLIGIDADSRISLYVRPAVGRRSWASATWSCKASATPRTSFAART